MKKRYTFDEFVEIVRILRAPGGCPWDAEQTHASIRNEFIEETYEAVDAIDNQNDTDLCEELGDVLLQILMHSQMADEIGSFNVYDVISGVAEKMVLRHPHVFGDTHVENSDEVLINWEKIKRQEKHQQSFSDTLKSVPKAYPALMRAQKVQKRYMKAGLDFGDVNECYSRLEKSLEEMKNASGEDFKKLYGSFLFNAVMLSAVCKTDSEEALNKKTDNFISDFFEYENQALEQDKNIKDVIPTDFR